MPQYRCRCWRWLILLLALGVASPVLPANVTRPAYPDSVWQQAEAVHIYGWSAAKLAQARTVAETIGSAAVMVVDRGVVIAAWGDVSRKYRCHSMRKSLISALFGIAVERGQIDVDATLEDLSIDDHPPALTADEKRATVADLLKARSGVYHAALSESPEMKARRPERHSHGPGTFWYYNNWDFNALGTIFAQTSGTGVFAAFDEEIAGPIGMQDWQLADGTYRRGAESRHPTYKFRLSTRDLARFGLLYLRQGRWGDRQVIPASWIAESTRAHSTTGLGQGYGYMWWTVDAGAELPNVRIPEPAYYASGYRGHRMLLMPERDLLLIHRVDTDLPQRGPWMDGKAPSIDNHRIGRLLWKLLDAAGMAGIGADPSWNAAPGERLEGPALQELLLSRRIEMGNGFYFNAYADGRCAIFRLGQVVEKGRWWVTADRFCSRWEGAGKGTLRQYRITVDGDTIRRYALDGTLVGVGRLVK